MNLPWSIVLSASLTVLAAGCGSSEPEAAKAGGTVTFKSKPLPNASVTFTPEKGPPAVAVTDDQGRFALTTGTQSGAVPGKHAVSIYAVEKKNVAMPNLPDPKTDPEAYALAVEEAVSSQPQKAPKWLIPQRYGRTITSGLSFEVKAGEENQFSIELKD